MKHRKTIAVVAADVFSEYINLILTGITNQANALDYDVAVFMMTFNNNMNSPLQYGEENIFNLINNKVIDGVVFIGGNIARKELYEKLVVEIKELGLPAISIDNDTGVCENVNPKDTSLIELITDHFIELHGCREIMCLTGPENIPQSITRLEGYKKSLEKHGIEFREELVVYGDFWKPSAEKLAEEFITKSRKLPEAIVCASDRMASSLTNKLITGGVKVPDEVRISGYDGSQEALNNVPSVTTIIPLNEEMGARAVCRIHKLITGEEGKKIETPNGTIITAQTCGCGEKNEYWVKKNDNYYFNAQSFDKLYRSCGMTEALLEADNFDELIHKINSYTYLIYGLDTFMLCLCDQWNNIESNDDNDYLKDGYSEKMTVKFIRHNDDYYLPDEEFRSEEIMPDALFRFENKPSTYFFMPIHFEKRCFGYAIFKFKQIIDSMSTIYAMWCRNINISLEFLRVRDKLTSINQRIFLNSIRDTLTGIYNHKGFKRYSEQIFKTAKAEAKKLLVMVVDLDGLKHINDNFGHLEGDNAIVQIANILNKCCLNNEICARIGGDEYVMIGCYEYSDEMVNSYLKNIETYIEKYNSQSGKPYKIGASIGVYCDNPNEDTKFEECFSIADKLMYENKFARKKNRTT
ncbi:MAG: GGDEF domain-containing protein [Ruminococcus sp.]|nr:GGDEF domain-containing protein [Ruminococcus sp.]